MSKVMRKFAYLLLLGLTACMGGSACDSDQYTCDLADMRGRLDEYKHDKHTTRTEIELLEDRLERQDRKLALSADGLKNELSQQLTHLETRLAQIDRKQQQLIAELKHIGNDADKKGKQLKETKQEIARLQTDLAGHVDQFKGALESVVELVGHDSVGVYHVKAGDSLGAIALKQHTTVVKLRVLNDLKSDRIYVGQKLKVPAT